MFKVTFTVGDTLFEEDVEAADKHSAIDVIRNRYGKGQHVRTPKSIKLLIKEVVDKRVNIRTHRCRNN